MTTAALCRFIKPQKKGPESGFTLVETIVTVVIISFVAVMMLSYFGVGIYHSADPIARLQASESLHGIMDKITAQYAQYPHWQPNTTYSVNQIVIPSPGVSPAGYEYISSGGISGATEPSWPLPPSATTVTDNTITWTADTTKCAPTLSGVCTGCIYPCTFGAAYPTPSGLQSVIGYAGAWQGTGGGTQTATFNNSSVTYQVYTNSFIQFPAGAGTTYTATAITSGNPMYGRYLLVTIGLPSNAPQYTPQTLTTMFVIR